MMKAEAIAISMYAGRHFAFVYEYLEKEVCATADKILCAEYSKLLFQALSKLPSYNSKIIFRLENNTVQTSKWFGNKIGQAIRFRRFSSTYSELPEAKPFFQVNTSLNSRGKCIEPICQKSGEKEVLF